MAAARLRRARYGHYLPARVVRLAQQARRYSPSPRAVQASTVSLDQSAALYHRVSPNRELHTVLTVDRVAQRPAYRQRLYGVRQSKVAVVHKVDARYNRQYLLESTAPDVQTVAVVKCTARYVATVKHVHRHHTVVHQSAARHRKHARQKRHVRVHVQRAAAQLPLRARLQRHVRIQIQRTAALLP